MLHWRKIKVYARSVWDVIIIITAFCLANDSHLLFSAQWLQKPLGGGGGLLTRGWLIYWASSSPSSHNTELPWAVYVSLLLLSLSLLSFITLSLGIFIHLSSFSSSWPLLVDYLHFLLSTSLSWFRQICWGNGTCVKPKRETAKRKS